MSDKEMSATAKSAASKLFDIRLLIGGLFVVYGVMLTVAGFVVGPAQIAKAAGINMNLWLGLGMLVVGVLFLLWRRLSPDVHPDPDSEDDAAPQAGGH